MERPDFDEIARFVGVGGVLDGKYRIQRILGVGGMGVVVAAEHLTLGESVAIKFLLPRALGAEQRTARFLREARAASRIKSVHVARVYDVDVREDGAPYIVMEHLQGETLQALLERGPLSVTETVDAALEACEALAEAHALGIVHRDLKPANLFLARGAGNVITLKVLDFGISKILEPDALDATTGESFLGSPPYMSPEQLTTPSDVDHRSDIWSLGVILYECLGGERPFSGTTFAQVCGLILHAEPAPLAKRRPELPEPLLRALERCLRKERSQRFANMQELARAIAGHGTTRSERALLVVEALQGTPKGAASADAPPPERPTTLDTGTLTAAADSASPSVSGKQREARWAGALLLAALVVAAVAIALWNRVPTASDSGGRSAHSVAPRDLAPPPSAPAGFTEMGTVSQSAGAATSPLPPASATAADARVRGTPLPGKLPKAQPSKVVSASPSAGPSGARAADPVFDERK